MTFILCTCSNYKFLKFTTQKFSSRTRDITEKTGTACAVFSVLVFEIYPGFGSVTVFFIVTIFGYGSFSVSLKHGRLTGFLVSVRLTYRFLLV